MPISLHRLPYLVQRELLQNLELPEIIQLSATSARTTKLFRFTKPSTESLKITIERRHVELFFPDSNLKFFHLYNKPLTNSAIWSLAGSPTPVQAQQRTLQFLLGVPRKVKDKLEDCSRSLGTLLNHLTTILTIQRIDVEIKDVETVKKLPVIFSHLKSIKFRKIIVEMYSNVKADDLKSFLELVNAQKVEMKCSVGRKHMKKCQNVQQLSIEKLETSAWFDFTDAPNAKSINLYGGSHMGGLKEPANLFIKSWITGSHQFVENLEINGYNENGNGMDKVLKDIETEETQLTEQELNTFHHLHDCESSIEHARDIVREFDGLRATVICCEFYVSVMVWTEENLKKIGRNQ